MPTLKKPVAIHVKVTNGTQNQYIKVTNFTSGGTATGQLNASKEVVVKAPSGYTWSEGDTIQIEVQGEIVQGSKTEISKGGASVTLGNSANSLTAAVNM